MNAKTVHILDEFVARFGGELLPRLKQVETQGQNLLHELDKLEQVREDPSITGTYPRSNIHSKSWACSRRYTPSSTTKSGMKSLT